MFKRLMRLTTLAGLVTAVGVFAGTVPSVAGTAPSGQVMIGNTTFDSATGHFVGGGGTIEPAYNDNTGTLIYLENPNNATVNSNDHNVAPIYIIVYPVNPGFTATLNCAHVPADNCPDHGPLIAGAAESAVPNVYGNGVLGHDHLVGIASTGGDFNALWEPTLVLFTSNAAVHAVGHITTLTQLTAALANKQVFLVPLPQLDFYCIPVSAGAYDSGTPAPTVTGP